MRKKINEEKRFKHKSEVINSLYDRNLIDSNENVVIASGFENAIIGVSNTVPKLVVYDYWVSLDIMLKNTEISFDDAQDWLDEFSLLNNENNNDEKVLFVKTLNPILNY